MLADDVVGAWELVSFTAERPGDPEVSYPLGPDATGIIMYTADGYMSAQIMRLGRRDYDPFDGSGDDVEQAAAAATGYLAYSGPYTADEATQRLHHDVEVSLLPRWLNTIQIREATLDGDQLTLAEEDTLPSGPIRFVLIWKRAASPGQ